MKPSVADRIKERLEKFTEALESGDCIQEQFTCRKVEFRLNPQPYDPRDIKKTRALMGASQKIFAIFLGTSVKTIQAWEQGTSAPNKMACRFMDLIQRDPEYWREILRDQFIVKAK
jgi:putative transcriptional regulator